MTIRRPVLRYHGGKFGSRGVVADWIIAHLPAHRVYVEPFGGAASVLMRKQRAYAEVFNDLADEVVNVFRVLRDHPADVEQALRLTPFARREFETAYEPSSDPVEQARRTIFRSMAGFGSAAAQKGYKTGFRANSNRLGTTPARDWQRYPDLVGAFAARLQGVVIEHRDAVQVMRHHDSEQTLHFVDPPYVHGTRKSAGCYQHEMDDDDHRALADVLHALRGMVVLCGYQGALYDELFPRWPTVKRKAYADGARERTEVLWFNETAWQSLKGAEEDIFA